MAEVQAAEKAEKKEKKEKSNRRQYRNDKWTEEEVQARKAELTVAEIPEGWVKVAEVGDACRQNGIPVSKFVRAFGGDRGMQPPTHEIFKFVYVGRTRYVSPDALTKGIQMLKDPSFMKSERAPRKPKAEKPESGPVASAKTEAPPARRVAVRPAN